MKSKIISKPKTRKEAENPEVNVAGYGVLSFENLKKRVSSKHNELSNLLKNERYASYINELKVISGLVQAVLDIELEMESTSYQRMMKRLKEDSVVGNGHIAGLGVGDEGEPGVSRKKQKKYVDDNSGKIRSIMRRLKK